MFSLFCKIQLSQGICSYLYFHVQRFSKTLHGINIQNSSIINIHKYIDEIFIKLFNDIIDDFAIKICMNKKMVACNILVYLRKKSHMNDSCQHALMNFIKMNPSCIELYQYEDQEKDAHDWIFNREEYPLILKDTINYKHSELKFNIKRLMFVAEDSKKFTSVDINNMMMITSPDNQRFNIIFKLIQNTRKSFYPYLDKSTWLVKCNATLLVCRDCDIDIWEQNAKEKNISYLRYNCISNMVDANIDIVLMPMSVLNKSHLNLEDIYQLKNNFEETKNLSNLCFRFQDIYWKRVVIDHCHKLRCSPEMCIHFEKMLYLTHIPESLVSIEKFIQVEIKNDFLKKIIRNKSILYNLGSMNDQFQFKIKLLKFKNTIPMNNVKKSDWIPAHVSQSSCFHHTRIIDTMGEIFSTITSDSNFMNEQRRKYHKLEEVCSICLSNKADCIVTCGHMFCSKCILQLPVDLSLNKFVNKQVRIVRTCPICRLSFGKVFCRKIPIDERSRKVLELCQRYVREEKSIVILCQWKYPLMNLSKLLNRRNIGIHESEQENEVVPKGKCRLIMLESEVLPSVTADVCVWMHFPVFANEIITIASLRLSYYISKEIVMIVGQNAPDYVECQRLFEMNSTKEITVSLIPCLDI